MRGSVSPWDLTPQLLSLQQLMLPVQARSTGLKQKETHKNKSHSTWSRWVAFLFVFSTLRWVFYQSVSSDSARAQEL